MKAMRGFVFSLDAFVAFILALMAVYSLIFFSSMPASYYYLLTQGHYLARDALFAVATTECGGEYSCGGVSGSILDAITSLESVSLRDQLVADTIGNIIPNQFGYILEMSEDQGQTWTVIYDTSAKSEDPHAKKTNKMRVSSQIVSFGYTGTYQKPSESPFKYSSCNGGGTGGIVITCGEYLLSDPDASATGEIVPLPKAKLVRLTIFI